ncbi:MAG: hypothetical protein BWY41_00031 [Candidatus Atribacteria bacterium ADurb.Bin276]|uniref:Uncharacterized protein n=1 Tax=Candidatus Atribacter allofermentans TaxID=1852833 RepID=A0A1V5T4R1_9BACT|nr:MAG: hypothetical protein BWY41_00031 [Candidatus Atribacteria bacterium ADurb.Bin276]
MKIKLEKFEEIEEKLSPGPWDGFAALLEEDCPVLYLYSKFEWVDPEEEQTNKRASSLDLKYIPKMRESFRELIQLVKKQNDKIDKLLAIINENPELNGENIRKNNLKNFRSA